MTQGTRGRIEGETKALIKQSLSTEKIKGAWNKNKSRTKSKEATQQQDKVATKNRSTKCIKKGKVQIRNKSSNQKCKTQNQDIP